MIYTQNIDEKKRILEMHSKMKKKIISEQTEDVQSRLQSMIDFNLISKPAEVVGIPTSNPQLKYAIKKESKKTPGTFKYYFIDGRIGGYINGNFVFDKEKWDVKSFENSVKEKKQEESDRVKNTEIVRVKNEGNWKERSELSDVSDQQLANTEIWEKIEVKGVPLYRKKATITVPSTYEGDVKKILDYFRKLGWQSADEVPAYLRLPSNAKKISELFPEWRQYFTDDITLYYNSEYKKQQETTPENENAPKERLSQFLTSLEQLTTDDCVKYIDNLYQGYRLNPSDVPIPEIKEKVKIVQYCIRKFNFDTPIYSKTRKKIFVLAGYSSSKDVGTPQASPYRISLPNNYKP